MSAWVSRQGGGVLQATRDGTGQTGPKAADLAVHAGRRRYTDAASRSRALQGSRHECVKHTQKEDARGDVPAPRAAWLGSLLKPSLRVFRGLSKTHLPGYVGFVPFLRNCRQQNACAQAALIVQAALDPAIARQARRGECVTCLDHFDLRQIAIN
jgi:hypothetical protein